MIDEIQLKQLSVERQAILRAKIDSMVAKGYPREFLVLLDRGMIGYDCDAHGSAIELCSWCEEEMLVLLRRAEGVTLEELRRELKYDTQTILGMMAVLREEHAIVEEESVRRRGGFAIQQRIWRLP